MNGMFCSALFIRPFFRALALHPEAAAVALAAARTFERQGRVPLSLAYASVRCWVHTTGDADLGLRAGATMHVGASGALDFAMRTASSLREAVSIAAEYHELLSDAFAPAIYDDAEHAFIELANKAVWPRAVADFTMSAWYLSHVRDLLPNPCELEVWFAHEQPANVGEYHRLFASAQLRFGAPRYGFRFPREHANAPLETGDRRLHALHYNYLELLRSRLGQLESTTRRVRALLANDLLGGGRSADSVARALNISRRTLVRRLQREGTSFAKQREEHRRRLAFGFVALTELPLREVSDVLGFSHVQGFHRAFKRWSGETPQRYRVAATCRRPSTPRNPTPGPRPPVGPMLTWVRSSNPRSILARTFRNSRR